MKDFIQEGVEQNEFELNLDEIDAILEVFQMVLKGLEIPFFVQGKFEKYAPHMDEMMKIIIKGISK